MNNIEFIPGKLYKLSDSLCKHQGFKTNVCMCLAAPVPRLWKITYNNNMEVGLEYSPCIKILVSSRIEEVFSAHPIYNFSVEEF